MFMSAMNSVCGADTQAIKRLITEAGWQSGLFNNELVLYLEYISVYSPHTGLHEAHLVYQRNLYQDFTYSCREG